MSTRAAARSTVPVLIATFLITIIGIVPVTANSTPQTIPFSQDWSDTGLITADDNWTAVPGIVGYLGNSLTATVGADPQTVLVDGSSVDVIANQTDPSLTQGGVAEFVRNPAVASGDKYRGRSQRGDGPEHGQAFDISCHSCSVTSTDADNAVNLSPSSTRRRPAYATPPASWLTPSGQAWPTRHAGRGEARRQPKSRRRRRIVTTNANGDQKVGTATSPWSSR
jgi:hypothetical protein